MSCSVTYTNKGWCSIHSDNLQHEFRSTWSGADMQTKTHLKLVTHPFSSNNKLSPLGLSNPWCLVYMMYKKVLSIEISCKGLKLCLIKSLINIGPQYTWSFKQTLTEMMAAYSITYRLRLTTYWIKHSRLWQCLKFVWFCIASRLDVDCIEWVRRVKSLTI